MKIIGVTGGVGAGKSEILDYLEREFGAYVIKADEVGHKVMEPGHRCYEEIIALFGTNFIKDDKSIDRKAISDVVFSEADKLEALNAIVHPAVKQYILDKIEQKKVEDCPICVVESAILLQVHYQDFCDQVWYIYTDPEIRRERLKKSRGYTEQKVDEIIANQPDDTYYRSQSDLVIDNSGSFDDSCEQIRRGLQL